ncbi:MAG TPA: hypothetical protein VGK91_00950 [Candidatus Udaeobacter sp.]
MSTWVEAPPRRKGLGCFARGCLTLSIFAIVLAIAGCAGLYWGLHRNSALFYGSYWLAKTRSLAEAPATLPEFNASDQQIQVVQERWQAFEQKTRAGQPAEIELSADDINALIATSEDVRGKVFASIDGNLLRLQTSVPIGGFLGRPGYYFNGNVIIELEGVQSLDDARFRRITINGEKAPTDFLDWKYRYRQLREYLADQADAYEIGIIEIRDGKVILRSRIR